MEHKTTAQYKIGQQFIHYAYKKQRAIRTVVDILTTTNSKGDVVQVGYISEHEFAGQKMRDSSVTNTTLARSLAENPFPIN